MERLLTGSHMNVCSFCFKNFLRSFASNCSTTRITTSTSRLVTDGQVFGCLSVASSMPSRPYFTSSWIESASSKHNLDIKKNERIALRHVVVARNFATDGSPLPPRKPKLLDRSNRSPITWKNLIIIGACGGIILLGMNYLKQEKEQARQKAQNKKIGKAKLGGDWTLTDHHGNVRSSKDFRGQWLLIYFGFTNCPDICPEEMEKIVGVLEKTDVDPELPKIQPIIITVDPLRDTPEALKEYCAEFSPRLLGFSGTEEQIEAATRAYRVYYSSGPKDEDNDYIVDHSIISYLVNPDGEFTEYFGQNKKVDEIYSSAKLHILSYMKRKAKSE